MTKLSLQSNPLSSSSKFFAPISNYAGDCRSLKKYFQASALVVLLVRHGVVLEHEEERPHDGGAGLGVGGHGGAGVVGEAGVDAGQAAELLQRVLVRVELVISLGVVTLPSGRFQWEAKSA